jgi:integrase
MKEPYSHDKWINVDKRSQKLVIRFHVKGFEKQFFLATGLKDTKRNRDVIRSRRDAIANDIALQRFDSTLKSYQLLASSKTTAFELPRELQNNKYKYNLLELWYKFTDFQSTLIEQTTILTKYEAITRYTKRLPDCSLEKATEIRDWLLKNTTKFMAWDILNNYSRCCNWAVNSKFIPDNPFEKLKIKKPKRKLEENYQAFTIEQRDIIINAFEEHPVHSHYASLIKFLFWTGCRPGEAFALTWGDISEDCCRISINKSCNLHRILKGTKNGKNRIFPTSKGSKLQQLLLTIRPERLNPKSLVFHSKSQKPLSPDILQHFWNESTSGCDRNGEICRYPGVVKELASKGEIDFYLKPYATRHTFATWAIAHGISLDKVAMWIGDEVETVLRHYCHPNVVKSECPDF